MDSFCDFPRTAPVPASAQKIPAIPVVPDVSMICQNNTPMDSMYLSYNAWKARKQPEPAATQRAPIVNPHNVSKQVRFESPMLYQQQTVASPQPLRNSNIENCSAVKPQARPFEHFYMANVPNRHLDLSIIEPPQLHKENVENIRPNLGFTDKAKFIRTPTDDWLAQRGSLSRNVEAIRPNLGLGEEPKTSRTSTDDWLAQRESLSQRPQKDTSGITEKNRIIDMYNYKRDSGGAFKSDGHRHILNNTKIPACESGSKCACNCTSKLATKEAPKPSTEEKSDDFTAKDLLKIIQQQNEQILNLQKQVATLLDTREPKQIEPPRNLMFGTSTQLEAQAPAQNFPVQNFPSPSQKFQPKKGPLQQFSMDVMTSFEVSIRPQNRARRNIVNHQPKITEITETDSEAFNNSRHSGNILDGIPKPARRACGDDTLKNTDVSLTFNEPVQVRETCPSPVKSVQIQMNDYSDDSDQEDPANPGWTFYNGMMRQVNHILKKSGIQPVNGPPTDPVKHNMMKQVKEATIKHLKSIGVHVPAMDDDADNSAENVYNPNEVSFAVKQLLMKYLPSEQLAKIANVDRASSNERPGLIKRRPEFSFATVQYMQKYNLLKDGPDCKVNQPQVQLDDFERILDVTAIKQQPKLL